MTKNATKQQPNTQCDDKTTTQRPQDDNRKKAKIPQPVLQHDTATRTSKRFNKIKPQHNQKCDQMTTKATVSDAPIRTFATDSPESDTIGADSFGDLGIKAKL